ncbi:hypothetical protein GLOTRDRAFT_135938 [Gloeophyllum trabeum ATCC 11539]|uniref:RRM domain-containing protein n=1 Tax=Gloeophyllum trabeum (strain ATCC 11539 / FP-39264 / Madison 617) TaxID=670483 RepID=S7RZR4_GLOTA|nr:uncharacterized protein GLOTRDRAFT_135938 [Gloeophyllum trabeum ATCC 11539]EPQ58934.1 hypothetical protein GLOTRDRAFT_135938 [Gloeophyllum trabeum ATCC 11539]
MSRLDDFEYPPGLGYARTNADREHVLHQSNSASLGGFGLRERRTSLNGLGYSAYNVAASLPRSSALPEHDFGGVGASDAWAAMGVTPNMARQATATQPSSQFHHIPPFNHHHHQRSSPPSVPPIPHSAPGAYISANGAGAASANLLNGLYAQTAYSDRERDAFLPRQSQPVQSSQIPTHSPSNSLSLSSDSYAARSTLWWGGLEPWMDEEYAKQVCGLMGWNPTEIRVPHPPPDPVTGQQANNPGYCFLTFASPGQAASVLGQMNSGANGPMLMPNSNKPFALNWASNVPSSSLAPTHTAPSTAPANGQRFEKEYSIFVGDLPPEASNSDLVAVFRNPVLGLRNDREPKFVRPFLSCKSAKIMLDPVTGVSRGYGFVRFTDEADQQRALVEMHGLYCLSRPMRISPATAKFKPPPSIPGAPLPFPSASPTGITQPQQGVTIAVPLPATNPAKSVSAPIASNPNSSSESTPSVGHASVANTASTSATSLNSLSTPSLSSGSSTSTSLSSLSSAPSDDMLRMIAQFANTAAASNNSKPSNAPLSSITAPFAMQSQDPSETGNYHLSEESWKHHAQARAILSNLIGPNGEQLTSSDPYNTTVFVGGLSPLISEETLRTFFAPFGDIHYVKVPVGKHCGFVQFVHKKDAERAIEKMQGFPIGGSRIRLSWGRSQYKAAQAAAQAAQAAALQAQIQSQAPQAAGSVLTAEQAFQVLEKFGLTAFINNPAAVVAALSENSGNGFANTNGNGTSTNGSGEDTPRSGMDNMQPQSNGNNGVGYSFDRYDPNSYGPRMDTNVPPARSSFSPFSPDPNLFPEELRNRDSLTPSRAEPLPHPSKNYAPGFGPSPLQTQDANGLERGNTKRISPITPTSAHANRPSVSRFNSFLGGTSTPFDVARAASRSSFHEQERPKEAESREHEQDLIQDLNGTLASLDLDNSQGSWRAQEDRTGGRKSGSPGRSHQ